MTKHIKIEVGSHTGSDTTYSHTIEGGLIYAFEPNPILYKDLAERYKDSDNVFTFPYAVTDIDGVATFNVCEFGDFGHGSLYDYHPDLANTVLNKHTQYNGTEKFSQCQVITIRLDTFMNAYDIDHVDFLWIDAQGSDLKVIKSLGARIKDVQAGRMECTDMIPIYTHSHENHQEEAKAYLQSHGFTVKVVALHDDNSDMDLAFEREE